MATDLIVIGAGPTGLMTALSASRCGLKVRIFEKRPTKTRGFADGIAARTLEIMDSFGLADEIIRDNHGHPFQEINVWGPDPQDSSGLVRVSSTPSRSAIETRFQYHGTHQPIVEQCMIDLLEREFGVNVERGVTVTKLDLSDRLTDTFPVTVNFIQSSSAGSEGKTVGAREDKASAKFLVGADGINSWTRKQLSIPLWEQTLDSIVTGILDIVPVTDFPDARVNARILNPPLWSATIPHGNGRIRVYVPMSPEPNGKRYSAEEILKMVQEVWKPFHLTFKVIDWHSQSTTMERMAEMWSDNHNRAFLAGDACHTHSPSTGQGMNTCICDGYNLGWKLAYVARGLADKVILKTYEPERRPIPEMLIAYDGFVLKYGRGLPEVALAERAGMTVEELRKHVLPPNLFVPGLHVKYGPNELVPDGLSVQDYASEIVLGMRMPYGPVQQHAGGAIECMSKHYATDGRFRIVIFAGDISREEQMKTLLDFSVQMRELITRFTPPSDSTLQSIFTTMTIHTARRHDINLLDLPEILLNFDDERGWNYNRVFADENGRLGTYEKFRIDVAKGAVVVMRPDQYVGYVGGLDGGENVQKYFESFMVEQRTAEEVRKTTTGKLWHMPWE